MATTKWKPPGRPKADSRFGRGEKAASSRRTEAATLVIATRSGLVQAGLQSVLAQVPELRLLANAHDASGAARSLKLHQPDVFVVDDDLVGELRTSYRDPHRPRVLLYTNRQHLGTQQDCGEQCACGVIRDQSPIRHIRAALRIIGACTSPKLGDGYCASCPLRSSLRLPQLPLSEREYLVFERIGHGDSNLEIARMLDRSVKTIETHRENIKRKLNLESGSALTEAAFAWKRGDFVIPGTTRTSVR